jgi:hypothetical protein
MELIDHIGTVSGIDGGIYCNTDIGIAQKTQNREMNFCQITQKQYCKVFTGLMSIHQKVQHQLQGDTFKDPYPNLDTNIVRI